MDPKEEEVVKETIRAAERIRCSVFFYGPELDLEKLERLVRDFIKCSVEVINGQSDMTETVWKAIFSRAGGGCLLITTEGKGDRLLSQRVRQGVNRLTQHEDNRTPFVFLAARVSAPSRLDKFVTSKFGIVRRLR